MPSCRTSAAASQMPSCRGWVAAENWKIRQIPYPSRAIPEAAEQPAGGPHRATAIRLSHLVLNTPARLGAISRSG